MSPYKENEDFPDVTTSQANQATARNSQATLFTKSSEKINDVANSQDSKENKENKNFVNKRLKAFRK